MSEGPSAPELAVLILPVGYPSLPPVNAPELIYCAHRGQEGTSAKRCVPSSAEGSQSLLRSSGRDVGSCT